MNITLRNLKFSAFASQDSNCFEATIYIDGVKAGTARDDGHGGCINFWPRDMEQRINDYAKTLPPIVDANLKDPNDETKPFSFPQTAETLIGDMVETELHLRDLKKLLKSKIVYIDQKRQLMAGPKKTPEQLQELLSLPPDLFAKSYPDTRYVLNKLPLEQALTLYRNPTRDLDVGASS